MLQPCSVPPYKRLAPLSPLAVRGKYVQSYDSNILKCVQSLVTMVTIMSSLFKEGAYIPSPTSLHGGISNKVI